MIKYKNFTLCKNQYYQIDCVKYEETYQKYLEEINKQNPNLAKYIQECPKIYTNKEPGSYLLMCNNSQCIGGIMLDINKKKLKIYIDLIEKQFKSKESLTYFTEIIIDSIATFFPEKEIYRIFTANDINLAIYFPYTCEEMNSFKNYKQYICHNKQLKKTLKSKGNKKR